MCKANETNKNKKGKLFTSKNSSFLSTCSLSAMAFFTPSSLPGAAGDLIRGAARHAMRVAAPPAPLPPLRQ
ncbi:hypothetical protein E2562_030701 [Oryza meyeriana var. granulata]|uniref:Uncharacterized protein n=1 Tax=Oryza meyeriana var. granulata TaxID=110450 RepID=A0A6G1DQH2_9ORYZ|nr:hypothetical protein E2562_030701 [Oryza meyeriana var. granulata]